MPNRLNILTSKSYYTGRMQASHNAILWINIEKKNDYFALFIHYSEDEMENSVVPLENETNATFLAVFSFSRRSSCMIALTIGFLCSIFDFVCIIIVSQFRRQVLHWLFDWRSVFSSFSPIAFFSLNVLVDFPLPFCFTETIIFALTVFVLR